MKSLIKFAPALVLAGALAACGTTMEQRAATGAIGGVAGAATTPRRPN